MTTRVDLINALKDSNVQAFLRALRLGEGTSDEDGYYRIVGSRSGRQFEDFSDHPRKMIWIPKIGNYSSAAGAYQIIRRTWDALVGQYGFEDFSPENQDQAAVALLAEKHALDDIIEGHIEKAIGKVRLVWASLPGAGYPGQREEPMNNVLAEFEKHGGTLA